MGIIANGAITLVLWYGAKLMLEGHVTAGVLTCKYTQPLRAYISLPVLSNAILKCLHGDFLFPKYCWVTRLVDNISKRK